MKNQEEMFMNLIEERTQIQRDVCEKEGHDPLFYQGRRWCKVCNAFEGSISDLKVTDDMFSRGGNVFSEGILIRPQGSAPFLTQEDKARQELIDAVEKFGINVCPVCKTDPEQNINNWIWCGQQLGGTIMCRTCGGVYVPLRDYAIHNFREKVGESPVVQDGIVDVTCPECGAQVSEEDLTCPSCGVSFEGVDEIILCPDCQIEVAMGDEICGKCGASLNKDQ